MHKVLKRKRDCLDGPLKNRLRQSTYTQNDETRLSVRSKDDKTCKYSYHTEYVHAMLSPEMKLVYMTYNEGSRSHKIQKEIIEGSNIHAITCDKFMTLLLKYRLNSHKYGASVMDAVNYILDDEVAFRRFLDDGHIEMHNIAVERMFRHIAMGRCIWMHVGSHEAAENISFIYSILESCNLNDISFGDYVEDVCTRIMHGDSNYESMLPCDYNPQKSAATAKAVA